MGGAPLRNALRATGAFLLLLWLAPPTLARTFLEQRYTTRDGLPSDLVKSIARDRFGFVWAATDAGLVRLDGPGFSTYEDQLSFPFGKDLHLARGGRLLAIGDAGLVEIGGTPARVELTVLFAAEGPPGPRALSGPKALFEDGAGRLWISEPRSIARVDGDRLVRYELPPSSYSSSFLRSYSLAEDGFGTVWAAAQTGGLLRFDEGADRFVAVDIDWPVNVLSQLQAVAQGRLWAAAARGLFEIEVTADGEVLRAAQIDDTTELTCVGRLGAHVILGTEALDSFVVRLDGERLVSRSAVAAFIVQQIFEDEDGSVWLSTDEGILRLRPAAFERLRFANERLGRYLSSFVQTTDGAIYASTRTRVFRLHTGPRGATAELLLHEPSAFFLGLRTDGRFVWAGREGNLLEFEGDRYVRSVPLEVSYAEDLERGPDSSLWLIVGNDDGILRIDGDATRRRYGTGDGLPRALAIEQSPAGELFVATNDPGGLLVRHDPATDSFAPVPSALDFDPGEAFNVYDMATDASGRCWLASTLGLIRVGAQGARRVEIGPAQTSPAAHAVTVDDRGGVWFATTLGVIRFDPDTGAHDLFDEESGLPSKVVGVRDLFPAPGGGVTAVTARGVARLVNTRPARRDLPAPALLELHVNDRSIPPDAPDLKVPYGGYLALRFASPRYEAPTASMYQVRLEGRDQAWLAPDGRNEVLLAGLPSGPYTLQVRAVMPGSDRASPETELAFVVARPWYQSWWALLLAASALGAVAWAASAVKSWGSARREERLRALVDERTGALSEANRQLGERNAEMERFIYTVSHDLKSPLISISGFIGLLERDLERGNLDQAGDSVSRVKTSASRMATLLDELLEMSRVGRVRDDPQQVDPTPLVEEVTREMTPRLEQGSVEVSVQPDMPPVWADRSRLRQVLQNLLDNSLRFFGDQAEPRIEIGGRSEGDRVRLFVRDNGIGIDPAHHEAAFELFRRLDSRVEGTGVGLSLVKRIVEVHGGRVWIESEGRPGRGTTVWVDLPMGPSG